VCNKSAILSNSRLQTTDYYFISVNAKLRVYSALQFTESTALTKKTGKCFIAVQTLPQKYTM